MAANEVDITVNATTDVDNVVERTADSVDRSTNQMVRALGDSEDAFDSAARASGRMGERLDMASGASSQLSGGIGDIGGALSEAFGEEHIIGQFGAQMESASAIVTGFTGVADLAMLANTMLNTSFIKTTATQVGSKIATMASTAATGVATAAQWAWNAAMTANPIGLIIAAVVLLIGVIVLIATKTTFFQDLWNTVWNAIRGPVIATFNFIKAYYTTVFNALFTALTTVKNFFINAFKVAIDFVVNYFQFIYSIPGKVASVFASIANAISAPFRAAFNAIARFWNNTVGRLSFSLPSWIPGIGGLGFDMPNLPTFATGAGEVFRTGAAMIHKGERIVPAGATGFNRGDGGEQRVIIEFKGADSEFITMMKKITRVHGGGGNNSVQIAWGS